MPPCGERPSRRRLSRRATASLTAGRSRQDGRQPGREAVVPSAGGGHGRVPRVVKVGVFAWKSGPIPFQAVFDEFKLTQPPK
jgi:hypothetical protein